MKVYFISLLSIILISTIPLSFAPSHLQMGGEQPIDQMPPIIDEPIPTDITSPSVTDIHIMLIVGLLIAIGIVVLVIRKRRK